MSEVPWSDCTLIALGSGNALARSCVYHHIVLLVESSLDRITDILHGDRPIALVPAANRVHAKEIAIAARDAGFGIGVIEERSERLLVLMVADSGQIEGLRRFVGGYGAEVATNNRHLDMEKVCVAASWYTGLAESKRADIGECF